MAVDTVTLAELQDAVAFELSGQAYSDLDSQLQTQVTRRLNLATQQLVSAHDRISFRVRGSIDISDGVSDYDLPDDFHKMETRYMEFSDSNTWRVRHLSEHDFEKINGNEVFLSEGRPRFYRFLQKSDADGDWILRFEPTPDSSYTVNFTYLARTCDLRSASTSDEVEVRFPFQWHDAIVWSTCLKLHKYFSSKDIALYKIAMRESVADMNANDDPQLGQVFNQDRFGGMDNFDLDWPRVPSRLSS